MKKIQAVFCIGLCALLLLQGCGSTFVAAPGTEEQETYSEVTLPEAPETWKGSWVWNDSNEGNLWVRFRKKVTLPDLPEDEPIAAYIAADSRYWLYVNGEIAVIEGSEKRGQRPDTIFYDTVDLRPYLKEGENTICLLAWYWGTADNISYVSTGRAGMYFQMDVPGQCVVSDDSWKTCQDINFLTWYNEANPRLPEKDVYYYGNEDSWTKDGYDDSQWAQAICYAKAGELPYGEMLPRQIPMIRDFGEKAYENSGAFKNYKVKGEGETLSLWIPYNAQVMPNLTIEAAEPNLEITIKTDQYADANGNSIKAVYVTREGEQSFECPTWMNGEIVYYEMPAGITVKSLGYREVGYDTTFAGVFSSDDDFYNTLWEKAQRTLYVCIHDTYMDCPNRERAQWFADMALEMTEAAYCLGKNKEDLYRNGLRTTVGWPGLDGSLGTIEPFDGYRTEVQVQMLMGFCSYWDYYLTSGDLELLEEVYEPTKDYLMFWDIGEDGKVVFTPEGRGWDWVDSTGNTDYAPIENAWYAMAMDTMGKIAEKLGKEEDVAFFAERHDAIEKAYESFWNGHCYQTDEVEEPDERANALAILAGFADESRYDEIAEVFETSFYATPLLEYYVESACMKMGRPDLAELRMKRQYASMIEGEDAGRTSTLWEYWRYGQGTQNHAWSGGPLVILSRDFAGLAPVTPGWERFQIRPQMGSMKEISCTAPTPSGQIRVQETYKNNTFTLKLIKPQNLTAEICVPILGDKMQITMNGEDVTSQAKADGDYLTLETPTDTMELEIRTVCQ